MMDMDVSPLPHKLPCFGVAINVTLPSPSPEPTPEEEAMFLNARPSSSDSQMGETLIVPVE